MFFLYVNSLQTQDTYESLAGVFQMTKNILHILDLILKTSYFEL